MPSNTREPGAMTSLICRTIEGSSKLASELRSMQRFSGQERLAEKRRPWRRGRGCPASPRPRTRTEARHRAVESRQQLWQAVQQIANSTRQQGSKYERSRQRGRGWEVREVTASQDQTVGLALMFSSLCSLRWNSARHLKPIGCCRTNLREAPRHKTRTETRTS